MKVNIPTTRELVYRQYLSILNSVLGSKRHLDPKEIDILSKLLYIDHKYKHIPKEKRDVLIFHTETRKRIRQALGISTQVFNNKLSSLRKKKFIAKNNLLIQVPESNNIITLEFNLTVHDKA
jgi:hypothetical protein